MELRNRIMQNQQYWKLPWKTCGRFIVHGFPCGSSSACTTGTNSPFMHLARCLLDTEYRADTLWKPLSRNLHTPVVRTSYMSQTHSSVGLEQKRLTHWQSYHQDNPYLKVPKSANENEDIQRSAASLADEVYQMLCEKHAWLYPYSRTVAFSQSQNNGILESLHPMWKTPELKDLDSKLTTYTLDHVSAEQMSSLFLDLTHTGLEKTHPLMTSLFLQLQSKLISLDFVSLGKFLSAIQNYNSRHIIIDSQMFPQLEAVLRNGIKLEKDPKLLLEVLYQFSSFGLLQRMESALISELLLQVLSFCQDHKSIVNDLDLVVPLFHLVSVFMLGDRRIPFIESNIQDTSKKILKVITDVMLANTYKLNLHQLSAVTAMSAEEHLEFLSKSFLEKVQSRMETILLGMQDFTAYNILELQRLANLSWMKLPANCSDKILTLTMRSLKDPVEQQLPIDTVVFLKRYRAISDLLFNREISLSAKQSLQKAVYDANILPHLQSSDFIELCETISLYFSSKGSFCDFSQQSYTKLLREPLLNMTYKIRLLNYVVLTKRQKNTSNLLRILTDELDHSYDLCELKKLTSTIASAYIDTYYQNLLPGFSRTLCKVAKKRSKAQNDIRQLFLLGYDRKTSSHVKLCGLPGWRLQQQFRDLFSLCIATYDLRGDVLKALAILSNRDMDLHEFEIACSMAVLLAPSSQSQFYCNLLQYATRHKADMTARNFVDLLRIALNVGPKPEQKEFIQMAVEFVNNMTIDDVEPSVVFQILRSMSELMVFPQHCVTKVFQAPYINRVMELLNSPDLPYNESTSLLDNMTTLNRNVCLLCPEFAVPCQQELVESHPEQDVLEDVQQPFYFLAQKQCIQDALIGRFGGGDFVCTNHITSDGIHIDMVVCFDEERNVVKWSELDSMKKNGKCYTKVAVLFLHSDEYIFGKKVPATELQVTQKKAVLNAKGYQVAFLSCWRKEKYRFLLKRVDRILDMIDKLLAKT